MEEQTKLQGAVSTAFERLAYAEDDNLMDRTKSLDTLYRLQMDESRQAADEVVIKKQQRRELVFETVKTIGEVAAAVGWVVFTGQTLRKEETGYIGNQATHRELSKFLDMFRRKK